MAAQDIQLQGDHPFRHVNERPNGWPIQVLGWVVDAGRDLDVQL
jgi:hypothetical protein